jgi:glutathione S-transferase
VRLFLLNFEKELFTHVSVLESRSSKGNEKALEKARAHIRDRLTQLAPVFLKNKFMLGDNFSMLDVAIAPLALAPGFLRHRAEQERRAAAEVRRAHLLAPGLHRGADAFRKGDAQVMPSGGVVWGRVRMCCDDSTHDAFDMETHPPGPT